MEIFEATVIHIETRDVPVNDSLAVLRTSVHSYVDRDFAILKRMLPSDTQVGDTIKFTVEKVISVGSGVAV